MEEIAKSIVEYIGLILVAMVFLLGLVAIVGLAMIKLPADRK